MAGTTAASSITDALRLQADPRLREALFRNNDLMPLFVERDWLGGTTYPFKVHYAGNTSVSTYVEGQAIGAPGSQSYVTGNAPETHYKAVIQITGHVRDYTLNGAPSAVFYNQIDQEFTRIQADLVHKITTDMLGTGVTAPVGIEGIVDSTGSLHGLDPSTYTWWAAYEFSSGTTVTVANLDTALYTIRDSTYEGNTNLILCSNKQLAKLKGVYGNPGLSNSPVKAEVGANGYIINFGDTAGMRVGSIPVMPIKGMTDSIILGLQRETIEIAKCRAFTVEPLAKTDDSDKWLVTWAGGLMCPGDRRRNWKQTGLSA